MAVEEALTRNHTLMRDDGLEKQQMSTRDHFRCEKHQGGKQAWKIGASGGVGTGVALELRTERK